MNKIEVGKTYTTKVAKFTCRWIDGDFAYAILVPGGVACAWQLDGRSNSLNPDFDVIWPETPITREITYPAPETVAPKTGTMFWLPSCLSSNYIHSATWRGDEVDRRFLARGLVYLKKADAKARAEAMLK